MRPTRDRPHMPHHRDLGLARPLAVSFSPDLGGSAMAVPLACSPEPVSEVLRVVPRPNLPLNVDMCGRPSLPASSRAPSLTISGRTRQVIPQVNTSATGDDEPLGQWSSLRHIGQVDDQGELEPGPRGRGRRLEIFVVAEHRKGPTPKAALRGLERSLSTAQTS